jgi:CheY-like chemotaxis protein
MAIGLSCFEQFCSQAECQNRLPKWSYVEEEPMVNLARHEILVVDDDDAVRDSLGLMLTAAGYDVHLAENGVDALLQMQEAFPAVIISDLNMPQMSGLEFLAVVRRRFPQIPVIAMSGTYRTDDAESNGVMADAFYPKGRGSTEELLSVVAGLILTPAARPREPS